MGVFWNEKQGDGLSKIGLSIDIASVGLGVSIDNGGQLTRAIDIFSVPYPLSSLVVRSIDTPLFSVGREGEGVSDGSDPSFLCLARRWTPFSIDIAGVDRLTPHGGRSRHSDPCGKA